jgi:hypothetical protein
MFKNFQTLMDLSQIFFNSFCQGSQKSFIFKIWGKLKFQITNQQITIQTKFSGLKIEDFPKQNMQQCAAKFAAHDFPI